MSYYFPMTFAYAADEGEAYTLANTFVEGLYLERADYIAKQGSAIPSIFFSRFDDGPRAKELLRIMGMLYAGESLTRRFVYWPGYNLLAAVSDYIPKLVQNDFSSLIAFQNSTDQDYDFSYWPKLHFFKHAIGMAKSADTDALREAFPYIDAEDESDLDHHRRSLAYKIIFDRLHLREFLMRGEMAAEESKQQFGFFRFAMNPVTSQVRESEVIKEIRKAEKDFQDEINALLPNMPTTEATRPVSTEVVIEVSGGMVQNVYANGDVEVEVLDFDSDDPDEGERLERDRMKLENVTKDSSWKQVL